MQGRIFGFNISTAHLWSQLKAKRRGKNSRGHPLPGQPDRRHRQPLLPEAIHHITSQLMLHELNRRLLDEMVFGVAAHFCMTLAIIPK